MNPDLMRFPIGEGKFNTLVQSGTTSTFTSNRKKRVIVTGNGTELKNITRLKGWAKRKTITQKMVLALIDIAIKKGKNDQVQSYWNTYHCLSKTISSGERVYGKYCKNRFCSVCLGIRKAEILNKYYPILKDWKTPYFVTLTIKAVPAYRLNLIINKMVQGFQRIKDKYRKNNQRGLCNQLVGIKSLECNFNPVKRTYNHHYHLILPNNEIAEILIKEWCKLWKNGWSNRAAQHYRKVENLERDLVECVKYGSKIFTEPDITKKSKQKITHMCMFLHLTTYYLQ